MSALRTRILTARPALRAAGLPLLVALGAMAATAAMPEAQAQKEGLQPVHALTLRGLAAGARPGDVLVLDVGAPVALARARVTAFGTATPLWRDSDSPRAWQTLLGVDVETAPGTYPVIVEADTADGGRASARATLTVRPRTFGVRQLRVDPKFSSPPAEEMARIEREAKRLNAIFAAVNPSRHWAPPVARPVADRANSSFGLRSVFNGQPRGRHNGTDFASPRGTPVHAPAAGEVVLADDLYFTGHTVVIDHGQGLYSLMAHLESTAVKTGEVVSRLDLLGQVGATGRVTGPHLHWSVRLHGARVDPLSLVAAGRPTSP